MSYTPNDSTILPQNNEGISWSGQVTPTRDTQDIKGIQDLTSRNDISGSTITAIARQEDVVLCDEKGSSRFADLKQSDRDEIQDDNPQILDCQVLESPPI